jgi:hypothetical protein
MALLTRKRLILAKTEATYGTSSSPAGSDAVLVRNLEITPIESDTVSRDLIRPYLGNSESLLANTRVGVTFEVEFAGSGTAGTAPRYGSLLKACGLSETVVATTSVTYAPVSSSFSSCTIHVNVDGVLHPITGCRGTFSLNAEVGQIPTLNFTMTGIYNAPTDTAAPATTYTNQATPVIFKAGNTTAFSILSYSACLQSLTFDIANEVIYRELVGCDKSVLITNRAPAGTAVIEAPALATKDFFAIANNDTTGSISFQHGQTAGNIVTFTAQKIDIGQPTYADQDGIQMLNLPYVALPTSAGNDELSLAYT